jgi:hypothetical protein
VFGWVLKKLDRFYAAAISAREWLFVYLVGVWVALLSLRALWAVVVHTEWLVALLGVLYVIGRRRERGRKRRSTLAASAIPESSANLP